MLHLMHKHASGIIKSYHLGTRFFLSIGFLFVLSASLCFSYAYKLGRSHTLSSEFYKQRVAFWTEQLAEQRAAVTEAKQAAKSQLTSLTGRLAVLQSHVLRLDALGERLVTIGRLDPREFNFGEEPGQGGPAGDPATFEPLSVPDFIKQLAELEEAMSAHQQRFAVLETLYRAGETFSETYIHGRPTKGGWISSYYGMRTDPFHGHRAWHSGVDLAGKDNAPIFSVGSGVVKWASNRYGYGKLIEIDHGNGYVTRYAHNKRVLVKMGQLVDKGQLIANMGSTGRSTGPHVHFEVLKNGKQVNPLPYIRRAAK